VFKRHGLYAIHSPALQNPDTYGIDGKKIYLIFPIPLTKKTFFEIAGSDAEAFFAAAENKNVTLVGGKIDADIAAAARGHKIATVDFGEDESFLIENAYLTAEAAVIIIMQTSCRSIRSMNIALFGYGRISKFLLYLLRSLGASVSVLARREEALTLARCDGACKTLFTDRESISEALETNDLIINTVPNMLLGEDVLKNAKARPTLLDLASLPGGIDIESARALGYRASRELGLPAKYAPRDAGEIVAGTVMSALF
jgi:dipicolinate synthase subunit A